MSDDRAAILRRRAAFLGSTLAVLSGCSRGSPPPDAAGRSGSQPVVTVAEPAADAQAPADPLPERSNPAGGHPSLETPPGVSEVARKKFEALAERMRDVYALFDALDVPADCDVTDSVCDDRWRKLADGLLELAERARFIVPVCKGSSESAKLYEQRAKEHADHVAELVKRIDQRIERALDGGGDAARRRWAEHEHEARRARPRVCLSFACSDW